jgi:hypothetical protein
MAARRSIVCRGMGLLDEAIREHLELRRRRGADPGLVAREEHEALGADREEEEPDHANAGAGEAPESVGQETVELDMADILYADTYADAGIDAGIHEPGTGAGDSAGHAPDEDEGEGEGEAAGLPSPIPGQERLGFG